MHVVKENRRRIEVGVANGLIRGQRPPGFDGQRIRVHRENSLSQLLLWRGSGAGRDEKGIGGGVNAGRGPDASAHLARNHKIERRHYFMLSQAHFQKLAWYQRAIAFTRDTNIGVTIVE